MNWKRVSKHPAQQPSSGMYKDWKQQLADEGFHQCVYCAVSEATLGGIRNFHVEHYKPKSKFKHLINDHANLFYVCPICNSFKSDDWPSDVTDDFSKHCYPNPSAVDYLDLFEVNWISGEVAGRNIAAKYVLIKLYLNRPQLMLERRQITLVAHLARLLDDLIPLVGRLLEAGDLNVNRRLLKEFTDLQSVALKLLIKFRELPPYRETDIERPGKVGK